MYIKTSANFLYEYLVSMYIQSAIAMALLWALTAKKKEKSLIYNIFLDIWPVLLS